MELPQQGIIGSKMQPVAGSHESLVQEVSSSQVMEVPVQLLPTQTSSVVQASPSSQAGGSA
jgi:hypothetical protein